MGTLGNEQILDSPEVCFERLAASMHLPVERDIALRSSTSFAAAATGALTFAVPTLLPFSWRTIPITSTMAIVDGEECQGLRLGYGLGIQATS